MRNTTPNASAPASLAQIKAECRGCDSTFAIDQLSRAATIEDAKTAYINTLAARLENREQRLAELRSYDVNKHPQVMASRAALKQKQEEIDQAKIDLANARMGSVDGTDALGA